MPTLAVLLSLMNLSATSRKNWMRRRRLRHLAAVVDQVMSDHPRSYCVFNHNILILRLWFNVEAELKQDFRLSRSAMRGLQRLIRREQDHGWGNELEVLIYVYWLAHGLSYRVVSRVFSVPKSTVHRVIHKVAQNIWMNLKRAIFFPQAGEIHAVGQGFAQLSGSPAFSYIVGAIDCSHIRIKPPLQHRIDYLNYKGFFLLTCRRFVIQMRNSSFYRAVRYPPTGYILLGDGGYPCLDTPITLITPYKEPINGQIQGRFNHFHLKGRSVIEWAFGMMKTRWRSTLFRALEVQHTFAPLVIASCAFLHNVCLDNWDIVEPDADVAQDFIDPQPPREPLVNNESSGSATRDRLAALVSGHVPAP